MLLKRCNDGLGVFRGAVNAFLIMAYFVIGGILLREILRWL